MEPTEFFRLFRGALRSVQLYPPDSPVVRRAAAAFHAAVAERASGKPEGISACFLEDGCFLDGRPAAARLPGEENAAAVDPYTIGIRELRFLDEVTVDEVERLLRPLARALLGQLNPVDEDLSLQLWEEDLPHITYLLYEEPAPADPEISAEASVPQLDPGIEAFLAEGSPFAGASPSASGFRLSEEERMRILAAYRREEDPDTPFKYGRLLLEILRSEASEQDAARTAEALRDHVTALECAGRAAVLRRLSERVEPAVAASPAAAGALAEIEARFRDPERLAVLLRARGFRADDRAAAAALAAEAPAEVAHTLLAALDEEPGGLDPAVADALGVRLASDHDLQRLCLGSARPALRRAALARFVPLEEDLRYLRELRQQAEPPLRILAVNALGRCAGAAALAGLADALDDPAPEVRLAAAEALGHRGGHAALEPLLRLVASRGFERRAFEERRAVLLAAGRAAPREVWPVLARLVERRRPFLLRRHDWSGEPALEALARLPEPVPTLLRERWNGRPDLREALDRSCDQIREGPGSGGKEDRDGRAEAA